MSEAAGSPTGVAFTDGARGIRPWLGGVALGTAGFAAATEYVASEHFRILEPVVTLTPVILASILATLAIGLHVVFFTTVPHRIAQLRDPTVWGLLAAGNLCRCRNRGRDASRTGTGGNGCCHCWTGRSVMCRSDCGRHDRGDLYFAAHECPQDHWCLFHSWHCVDARSDPCES